MPREGSPSAGPQLEPLWTSRFVSDIVDGWLDPLKNGGGPGSAHFCGRYVAHRLAARLFHIDARRRAETGRDFGVHRLDHRVRLKSVPNRRRNRSVWIRRSVSLGASPSFGADRGGVDQGVGALCRARFSWAFAALGEELAFRVVLQRLLLAAFGAGAAGVIAAIVLQAGVFGAVHIYQGPVRVIGAPPSADLSMARLRRWRAAGSGRPCWRMAWRTPQVW